MAARALQELADRRGISPHVTRTRRLPVTSRPSPQPHEEAVAEQLLQQIRSDKDVARSNRGSILSRISSTKSQHPWSPNEASAALRLAVDKRYTPGIVEALLQRGANVSILRARTTSTLKKLQKKDTEDVRNDVLRLAVEYGDSELAGVLASHETTDAEAKQQALRAAAEGNMVAIVDKLLGYGDSADGLARELRMAIDKGWTDLVELLVMKPNPVAIEDVTAALEPAVNMESPELVGILVAYGAIVAERFNDFLRAVFKGRIDLVLLMVLSQKKPSPETLARGVEIAYQRRATLSLVDHYDLVNILLLAGAKGDDVASTLISAVDNGDTEIAKLLLRSGADIQFKSSEALQIVVERLNMDLLSDFAATQRKILPEATTKIMAKFPYSRNTAQHGQMITEALEFLLELGAIGPGIDEAVIYMVEAKNMNALQLLLRHHASLNYGNGAALKVAVEQEEFDILQLMLQNGDSTIQTRSHAFLTIFKTSRKLEARLILASFLLKAGVLNQNIEEAFLAVLSDEEMSQDLRLINLLSSSVEYKATGPDEYLELAVLKAQIDVVEAMIAKTPPPTKAQLSKAIRTCMTIPHADARYEMLRLLLEAGADGDEVTSEFLKVIDGESGYSTFAYLFLDNAIPGPDVNHGNGMALLLAIKNADTVLLQKLVRRSPSKHSIANAIQALGSASIPNDVKLELFRELLRGTKKCISANTQALASILDSYTPKTADNFIALVKEILRVGVYLDKDVGKNLPALGVKTRSKEVVVSILAENPPPEAVRLALKELGNIKELEVLVELLGLLRTRIDKSWHELNEELLRAVGFEQAGLTYTKLLFSAGADVNYEDGKPLRLAINAKCLEQVKLCLQHEPSAATLHEAFGNVWRLEDTNNIRLRYFEEILQTASKLGLIPQLQETLAIALTRCIKMNNQGPNLLKLFLKYGASPAAREGEALCAAVKAGYVPDVRLLLVGTLPPDVLEKAFSTAWDLPTPDTRFKIIELLLHSGLRGPRVDEAVDKSVNERKPNVKLVSLLVDYVSSTIVLNDVLARIMVDNADWRKAETVEIVKLFLQKDATCEPGNFLSVVEETIGTENATVRSLFDVLCEHDAADVNFSDGLPLQLAVINMREDLVKAMLQLGPTVDTVSSALPCLFDPEAEDGHLKDTERMIDLFMSSSVARPRPGAGSHALAADILFYCMMKFPEATDLLEKLLILGYSTENVRRRKVLENSVEEEGCNALLWALVNGVRDESVFALITHGADINFSTHPSGYTPLSISITKGRQNITALLIERGANVNVLHGKASILHAASANGDVNTIKTLIARGAEPDDGSLHEAAARLHVEAVQTLLTAGHDPDYPSALHSGRSALMEMCFSCQGRGKSHLIKAVLRLLISSNTDLELQVDGKSLLFWALDNPQGHDVVDALLSVTYRKLDINREENICVVDEYAYGPLDYITRGISPISDQNELHRLAALLKRYRCKPRHYHLTGPQPPDAAGLPPHLLEEDKERRAVLRRIALANYEQDAMLQQEKNKHLQTMQFSTDAHALRLAQMREHTTLQNEGLTETHQLRIEHNKQEAIQREYIDSHRRDAEIEHQKNLAGQRLGFIDEEQRKLLDYRIQFDNAEHKHLERKLLTQRNHEDHITMKQIETIEAQKTMLAEQAKIANMAMQHARIGAGHRQISANHDTIAGGHIRAAAALMPPPTPRKRISEVPD